jgi:hypothetical protein
MIGEILDVIVDGLAASFGTSIFKSRVARLSLVAQFLVFLGTTLGWACLMLGLFAIFPRPSEVNAQPKFSFWWTSVLAIVGIAVAIFLWVLVARVMLGLMDFFTASKSVREDRESGE